MERAIKAMFDFMPERSPLAYFIGALPVNNLYWRVGCPYVADAINHFCHSFVAECGFVALRDYYSSIDPMPNDRDGLVLRHRGAAGEKQDEQETHTPILVQRIGKVQ